MTLVAPAVAPAAWGWLDGRGLTPSRIHSLYIQRKNKRLPELTAGEAIRRVYNGDWKTVLPELETSERTQVTNLVLNGIEQHALRIASTVPNIYFPPERNSKAARNRASDRTMVIAGWHDENKMPRIRRKRARHLVAYGSTPVYLRPGPSHIPIWETWDPLNSFPAPGDDLVPSDCIYSFKRSWGYLHDTYGIGTVLALKDGETRDSMVDVLFYADSDALVMVAAGTDADNNQVTPLLQAVPNVARRPVVIHPSRITLDRLQGQFDQMIGMYEAQGYLWAMHLQALKRAIFAETWVVGNDAMGAAEIISVPDPIRGDIGQINGGDVKAFRTDPSVQTLQAMDRLEASERQNGAIPAELGGQSASNIRTGRRGSQILSSAIDYPIQEHQEILADSNMEENLAAIDIARTYWGNTEKTLYVKFGDGAVTYTPNDLFADSSGKTLANHSVQYAYAGTDQSTLVIEALQMNGAGALSLEGVMEVMPLITDPAFEMKRVQAEKLREALMASIQQQAADPAGPYQPKDIAKLMSLVRDSNMQIEDAITKLQADLQAEQQAAAEGQLPPEAMQPGLAPPGAPGALPGMSPAATPDQQGLGALMGSLRAIQRGGGVSAPPGVA